MLNKFLYEETENDIEKDTEAGIEGNIIKWVKKVNVKELDLYRKETNQRFSDIMPKEMVNAPIVIIGAGGIGTWLVRALVSIGLQNITVIDYDTVDWVNIGPQSHSIVNIGMSKVDALAEEMEMFKGTKIFTKNLKLDFSGDVVENVVKYITEECQPNSIIINCVDNMVLRNAFTDTLRVLGTNVHRAKEAYYDQRKQGQLSVKFDVVPLPLYIYLNNEFFNNLEMYIDARMSLGKWAVYSYLPRFIELTMNYVNDNISDLYFTDEEGLQEPCTARAISFTGMTVSCYIASMLLWYFRNRYLFTVPISESLRLTMDRKLTLNGTRELHMPLHCYGSIWYNKSDVILKYARSNNITSIADLNDINDDYYATLLKRNLDVMDMDLVRWQNIDKLMFPFKAEKRFNSLTFKEIV